MGTYSDPALILPGSITNTEIAAAAAIAATKLDLPSNLTVIAAGTYTGNDTANRAIPHGSGAVPKLVVILQNAGAKLFIMYGSATIGYWGATEGGVYGVTAADSTNFYVGNATDYTESANSSGVTYKWVVFA